MGVTLKAVGIGMLVMLVGTIPRNALFAANLRYVSAVPWAVPLTAAYLWFFWRYLRGDGPPDSTQDTRRASLRANQVSGRVWAWALLAGGPASSLSFRPFAILARAAREAPRSRPESSARPGTSLTD